MTAFKWIKAHWVNEVLTFVTVFHVPFRVDLPVVYIFYRQKKQNRIDFLLNLHPPLEKRISTSTGFKSK